MDQGTKKLRIQAQQHIRNDAIKPIHKIAFLKGDKLAFAAGIVLTLLAVVFFSWKMTDNLTHDWSLKAVSSLTPTPPLEKSGRK